MKLENFLLKISCGCGGDVVLGNVIDTKPVEGFPNACVGIFKIPETVMCKKCSQFISLLKLDGREVTPNCESYIAEILFRY